MIVANVLDGAQIETRINDKFVIDTDQPAPIGADAAPQPFDVFLAGVAACAAYFAQRYCRKWKLSHQGIHVEVEPTYDAKHLLTDLSVKVKVPSTFPREHIEGLMRNVAACPVKKTLEVPPKITLAAVEQ